MLKTDTFILGLWNSLEQSQFKWFVFSRIADKRKRIKLVFYGLIQWNVNDSLGLCKETEERGQERKR